jgi:DNA-binding transcriptional regulator GbsR (MarR family)
MHCERSCLLIKRIGCIIRLVRTKQYLQGKYPMTDALLQARNHFIQGMSRISHFWGFPKGMGAIYGAIYLSPAPLSLDDLVEQANISKGAVSTNVRMLERLGMVHKHIKIGERRDFYTAETDFWKIVKGILNEREKNEFDLALRTVEQSLETVEEGPVPSEKAELAAFYQKRMQTMRSFFHTLDNLVATFLALDELRAGTIERLFGSRKEES